MPSIRQEASFYWYERCTMLSCQYPTGSIEQVFWWSLRFVFDHNIPFSEWEEYFSWKLKQQACWKHHTNHLAEEMCDACNSCQKLCRCDS